MSARFRKKPITIEAMQYDGTDASMKAIEAFTNGEVKPKRYAPEVPATASEHQRLLTVPTLEGDMDLAPGGWIAQGIEGEFYPIKRSIFEATYEAVDTPAQTDNFKVTDVYRVVDGDTYWFYLDVRFRATLLVEIRLDGYDTPEKAPNHSDYANPEWGYTPAEQTQALAYEKSVAAKAAIESSLWLSNTFDAPGGLWVHTEKDPDDFGRWLGAVMDAQGNTLGDHLVSAGLATVWPTRWRDEHHDDFRTA